MKRTLDLTVRRLAMLIVIGVTMLALGRMQAFAQMKMPQAPMPQTPMPRAQMPESAADLPQLVAPIALYPDELVAQILAASTYPTQIVEADRWLEQHSSLQGEQMAAAVDQQMWDPSVKALTEFPSVVSNMDRNIT